MRHSLNLNILRTGRSLHPYWLIFVISDEMIPPSFLCHLEQSMQCHLPSLIIMSIRVRPSVMRGRASAVRSPVGHSRRVGPGEGSGRMRGRRRARNGGDSAAGENVARGGGKMAASRGEGGEEEGGRLRRKHDGSVQQPLTEKNWPGTKKIPTRRFSASPGRASPIITHRQ